MLTNLQEANHYLDAVDRLESEGMYNQSQTELSIAVSHCTHFFPALRVRYNSERYRQRWIVSAEWPYGLEILLETPVLTEVTAYIRKILPKKAR